METNVPLNEREEDVAMSDEDDFFREIGSDTGNQQVTGTVGT